MYICICKAVTDKKIREVVLHGCRSRDEVTSVCGAGGDCGSCHKYIEAIIEKYVSVIVGPEQPLKRAI